VRMWPVAPGRNGLGGCEWAPAAKERVRNRARQRSELYTRIVNTAAWRKARAQAFRRDAGECQEAGRGPARAGWRSIMLFRCLRAASRTTSTIS
jgi:hypothetical protein